MLGGRPAGWKDGSNEDREERKEMEERTGRKKKKIDNEGRTEGSKQVLGYPS